MKHHICTPDLASWAERTGCDYQGEYTRPAQPAEACSEIGADDQWESADREVGLVLLKAVAAALAFIALVWMTKP